MNLDPKGIENIKIVLTLLDYTTIQSISKFSQKKPIGLLELEFSKFKKSNPDRVNQFPGLADLHFGSGFIEIIHDIAIKTKAHFMSSDTTAIEETVFLTVKAVMVF